MLHIDLAGLDRLDLSGDALDLIIQRIDGFGEQSQWLLIAAAAYGRRFRSDLVSMAAEDRTRDLPSSPSASLTWTRPAGALRPA
jgi:predicted ATPase